MAEIPVIFCFDDRILTGAGVSILSLLDAAAPTTVYAVHIFHPGLAGPVLDALRALVAGSRHSIRFHLIPAARFANVPRNKGSWTEIVYYRLLAAEILPDLDRAIYSDVDVFFVRDMAEAWAVDLSGAEWAGVAGEANRAPTVMHRHFPENPKDRIYFSGFMVMNLALMRANGAVARYFETIGRFHDRLKFFDLDVLNLATPRIAALPFDYVVLEDIYETPDVTEFADFAYLRSVYSEDDLRAARDNPAIIHFAGRRGKPWQRRKAPDYFAQVAERLPARLRLGTFRDFRKKWLSRKGRASYPSRQANPVGAHHGG